MNDDNPSELRLFAEGSPSAVLTYVAAPYSDRDRLIITARMSAFDKAVADLLATGTRFPVSPLMNHAILGKHKIPGNWEFWQHYSRRLLARCDEIVIVDMPGTEASEGVRGERDLAVSLHLPVRHMAMDQDAYDEGAVLALAREWPSLTRKALRAAWLEADRDPQAARTLAHNTHWSGELA